MLFQKVRVQFLAPTYCLRTTRNPVPVDPIPMFGLNGLLHSTVHRNSCRLIHITISFKDKVFTFKTASPPSEPLFKGDLIKTKSQRGILASDPFGCHEECDLGRICHSRLKVLL